MTQTRSKGKRVAIWVVLIFLGLLVLVVARVCYGYYRDQGRLSYDASVVEREARRLMRFDVPGGAHGVVRYPVFDVDVFVLQSRARPPDATLILAFFPPSKSDTSSEQKIRERIEHQVRRRMDVTGTRELRQTLCGNEVVVTVYSGRMRSKHRGIPADAAVTSYEALIRHQGRLRMAMAVGAGPKADATARAIMGSLDCLP